MNETDLRRRCHELEDAISYLKENVAIIEKAYGIRTYLAIKNRVIICSGENKYETWEASMKKFSNAQGFDFSTLSLEEALNPSVPLDIPHAPC